MLKRLAHVSGFLWTVASLLGITSCASIPRTAQTVTAPPADTDGVLGLIGRFGIAHACPVGPERILTAAHVLDVMPENMNFPLIGHTYTDRRGNTGVLTGVSVSSYRDLGIARPLQPLGRWYQIAAEPPATDEKLWLVKWDWDSRLSAFSRPTVEVTVLRMAAGYIVFHEAVTPGTSGGCVLNAKSEVVGIVAFGKRVGWADHHEVGVATAVYGVWKPENEAKQ